MDTLDLYDGGQPPGLVVVNGMIQFYFGACDPSICQAVAWLDAVVERVMRDGQRENEVLYKSATQLHICTK